MKGDYLYADKIGKELEDILSGNKDLLARTYTAIDAIVYMMENLGVRATALACSKMLPEILEVDLEIPDGATATVGPEGVTNVSFNLSHEESVILKACYLMSDALSGEDYRRVSSAITNFEPELPPTSETYTAYDKYTELAMDYLDIMEAGKDFHLKSLNT